MGWKAREHEHEQKNSKGHALPSVSKIDVGDALIPGVLVRDVLPVLAVAGLAPLAHLAVTIVVLRPLAAVRAGAPRVVTPRLTPPAALAGVELLRPLVAPAAGLAAAFTLGALGPFVGPLRAA